MLLSVVPEMVPVPELEISTVPRDTLMFALAASLSCTVIVTLVATVADPDDTEIVEFVSEAATVVTFALVPVTAPVVAESWCVTGVTAEPAVVKVMVAKPDAFVTDVGVEYVPPLVLPHVTVWPASETLLLLTSRSCAVTVMLLTGAGAVELGVTR